MRNLRLRIEYDGTEFHGFARQQGMRTVQGVLEHALTATLDEPIEVVGASRTDAGVHARGQVVNFRTSPPHPDRAADDHPEPPLASDLKALDAREVSERFHARFSAHSRVYRYSIYTGNTRRCGGIRYAWHLPRQLDCAAMHTALQQILGEHDFRPYSVKIPIERNTVRTLYRGQVSPTRDGVQIELEANGFLRGMVRLIVGDLTQVGSDALPADALAERLRTRQQATLMAPPQGLCLIRVKYRR
jgi:tRNA pseudouridine38-40 synthase